MSACCVCLWHHHMSYSGSVILVPTHASNSAHNIVPALRRSAVSVRDVCHSPLSTDSSANPDGQSPSEMQQPEASVMGKRLSTSTSHLGTRKAQRFSKGTAQAVDNEHVTDKNGKNAKSVVQQLSVMYVLMSYFKQ